VFIYIYIYNLVCFKIFAEHFTEELSSIEEDGVWVRGWFPLLFELSCIVSRCKLDIRTRALTVLFELIKTHGTVFKLNWWKDLFNVLFRIFDNVKHQEHSVEVIVLYIVNNVIILT